MVQARMIIDLLIKEETNVKLDIVIKGKESSLAASSEVPGSPFCCWLILGVQGADFGICRSFLS